MGFAKIGPGEGEKRIKASPVVNVTIAMFFDGTGNNMYNTDEREKNSAVYLSEYARETKEGSSGENGSVHTSSYENSYSNVARLFTMYNEDKVTTFKLYVEGMGTIQKLSDDVKDGNALGRGATGIPARVADGCKQIATTLIRPWANNPDAVGTLTIDIFGFSRGSAAARHFIYEITKNERKSKPHYSSAMGSLTLMFYEDEMGNKTEFADFPFRGYLGAYCITNKIILKQVNIRFVGLFDCVASYSKDLFIPKIKDDTPESFKDDTLELNLDCLFHANMILHLSAMDEHRGNFPLTNIASAGRKGRTFSLPGVHSDLGGCYADNIEENIIRLNESTPGEDAKRISVDHISLLPTYLNPVKAWFGKERLEKDKEWLKGQGWFNDSELTQIHRQTSGNKDKLVFGSARKSIPNSYSFIPVDIMFRFAQALDDGKSNKAPFQWNNRYSVLKTPLLVRIQKRLYHQVFDGAPPLTFKYYKEIFDTYNSSLNDSKMPPDCQREIQEQNDLRELRNKFLHWNSNYDRSTLLNLEPMFPRMINDKRERLILQG